MCVWIFAYICVCACVYEYLRICGCMWIWIFVYMWVHVNMNICVYVRACVYEYLREIHEDTWRTVARTTPRAPSSTCSHVATIVWFWSNLSWRVETQTGRRLEFPLPRHQRSFCTEGRPRHCCFLCPLAIPPQPCLLVIWSKHFWMFSPAPGTGRFPLACSGGSRWWPVVVCL